MNATKPFSIPKQLVWRAWLAVKSKGGAAGVDNQSLEDFERDLKNNLYRIWNRLCSGSYFPPPVKAVPIPKKSGGTRILGVPTISDRVAQTVVKMMLEPILEPVFDEDSYGYRPGRSAHDAIAVTRKRCWQYDWVVEFDIRGLFDNLSHELLMKALRHHCSCRWVLLYVERWLTASMQQPDGSLAERHQGTPQGGVVSPVLANLFLHYAFDAWVRRELPNVPFCRYADDGLLHCRSRHQAEYVMKRITDRFRECGLEIHPDKSSIVYCQDRNRREQYQRISFDFLGYTFRPRRCVDRSRQRASELSSRDQPTFQEGNQSDDSRLASSTEEREDTVGPFADVQSRTPRLAHILRAFLPLWPSAALAKYQPVSRSMGSAKVQTAFTAQATGETISGSSRTCQSELIRSLGAWRLPLWFG